MWFIGKCNMERYRLTDSWLITRPRSYELQVIEQSRGLGLGKLLTGTLSDIGSQWGMKKVMLTVFKCKPRTQNIDLHYPHIQ